MDLSVTDIQEILKIFAESELRSLHIEVGDVKLAVSKEGAAGAAAPVFSSAPAQGAATQAAVTSSAPVAAPASAPAPAPAPAATGVTPQPGWVAVTAPSLGVFYRRPAPDQPPFVEVGTGVDVDAPVCLIEVMKMFNRVPAPIKGRIAAILIEDGKMVEHGQTLMYVEPAA